MIPPESLGNGVSVTASQWPRHSNPVKRSIEPAAAPALVDATAGQSESPSDVILQTNSEPPPTREHLVVDAGGLIRLKQLHAFGFQTIHITPGVATEIRDQASRQHLQSLMVDLPRVSSPTEDDVAFVKRFAQQTGDLGFLSANDIEVIALTYMLQRRTGDVSNLKSRPGDSVDMVKEGEGQSMFTWGIRQEGKDEEESDNENNAEEDSEGEWICEDNLDEFRQMQGACLDTSVETENESERRNRVACLTTDYSIQNVLLQMGLSVLSIDGMRIKSTKKWALLCRSCRKVMIDTTKRFCGHCGNDALTRVAMGLEVGGKILVELPKNERNLRRKVMSVPIPRRKGEVRLGVCGIGVAEGQLG